LEFRLVVKECPEVGDAKVSATATQVLVMIDGNPKPDRSSFTTP
jgi:hypothetical protein